MAGAYVTSVAGPQQLTQLTSVPPARSLDEQCADYLQETVKGTLRMSRLIGALLDFSRIAYVELQRETVDLSQLARELTDELKAAYPERIVMSRITDGVIVVGDPDLLRVVLDNLLGNVWKYTGNREEAIIEFGSTEIDGQTACFVRDNGRGFKMADAEKLLQPFQRLTGAEKVGGAALA